MIITKENYDFSSKRPTYNNLIEEFKKNFNIDNVNVAYELELIFELKHSKSTNIWTLYYFENCVAD